MLRGSLCILNFFPAHHNFILSRPNAIPLNFVLDHHRIRRHGSRDRSMAIMETVIVLASEPRSAAPTTFQYRHLLARLHPFDSCLYSDSPEFLILPLHRRAYVQILCHCTKLQKQQNKINILLYIITAHRVFFFRRLCTSAHHTHTLIFTSTSYHGPRCAACMCTCA